MAIDKEKAIIEIILKGQQANASIKDMDKAVSALRSQLNKLPADSKEFAEKSKEFQQVSKRLKDVRAEVNGLGGTFGKIGNQMKAFGAMAASYFGLSFVSGQIRKIVSDNADLSDSLADIRKTTGMTESEVKKLNSALGQMNTRTAISELQKISIIGGQLGIAKGDIFGFTAAVDKMNVALGDEFSGGAEEVTKAMGGLRNIFTDIKGPKVDQDLLKIGNAINELASSGAATGPVVSDFANRIGGVGITLGLTSGQVLGLSATLQELNVSTERGGTAVTKILQKMTTNTAEFAKVANMPVKEFTELVNKDLYGAFLKVVEGSKQSGTSATAFGKILENLGVDGAGASEVFAKLGSNTQMLGEKVSLANTSLKGTSSIMNEFNTKNQTFAADLEKIGKGFSSWFSNTTVAGFFKTISSGLAEIFDRTPEVDKLTDSWRAQRDTVENLHNTMDPLLHRHDELKGKASLNRAEQDELRKIIDEVAKTIPFAVTEFDKYGKAMDINTSKGRDFIAMEEQMLEIKNKDALSARREELIETTKLVTAYQKALTNRDAEGDLYKVVSIQTKFGKEAEFTTKNIKLTNQEIINLQAGLQAAKDKQLGIVGVINELTGKVITANKSTLQSNQETADATVIIDEKEKQKLIDEYKKYQDELAKLEQEHGLAKMNPVDREFAELEIKYKELRERAKGNKKDLKRVEELYYDDLMALMMKHFERKSQEETKQYFDEKARAEEEAKLKLQMQKEIDDVFLTDYQKEYAALNKRYDDKIVLAQEKGIELNNVEEARMKELAELRKKYNMDEELELDLMNGTRKAKFDDYYNAVMQVLSSIDEAKRQQSENELKEVDYNSDQEIGKLKFLYNQKRISKEEYDKRVEKIEATRLAKQKQIKQEQAEREKRAAIRSAIISGFQGVAKTLGEYAYPYNLILAALHAVAAGVAVQNIQNAETPMYAEGGLHTSSKPAGFVDKPTLFSNSASGQNFIAGEAGAEWIAPYWMLQNPYTANTIGMLEGIRKRGYYAGGFTQDTTQIGSSSKKDSVKIIQGENGELIAVLSGLKQVMENGIIAHLSYDDFTKTQNFIDSAKASAQIKN